MTIRTIEEWIERRIIPPPERESLNSPRRKYHRAECVVR
jgi:hypothetical protein